MQVAYTYQPEHVNSVDYKTTYCLFPSKWSNALPHVCKYSVQSKTTP